MGSRRPQYPGTRQNDPVFQGVAYDPNAATPHLVERSYRQFSYLGAAGFPPPAPQRGERERFTTEDDLLLKWLKESAPKKLSWEQISDFFPGRKSGTLQVRYSTRLKERAQSSVGWTKHLDDALVRSVQEYKDGKWPGVAAKMGRNFSNSQFTPDACKERYEELRDESALLESEEEPET